MTDKRSASNTDFAAKTVRTNYIDDTAARDGCDESQSTKIWPHCSSVLGDGRTAAQAAKANTITNPETIRLGSIVLPVGAWGQNLKIVATSLQCPNYE